MEYYLGIALLVVLFLPLFYFGYKDDYNANPKKFIKTIFGMPLSLILGGFGFKSISNKIKNWALNKKNSKK